MMMTILCDVAPCSLVEIDDVSEVLTASIIMTKMMQAIRTSDTSISFYEATLRNIPQESSSNSPS
jgi:hypothetical protein